MHRHLFCARKLNRHSLVIALACVAFGYGISTPCAAFVPPQSQLGGAIGTGIAQTLIRRGIAANDPRILQTVASVGARVAPLAATSGTATWIGAVSRLSPWVTGGLLVYQGINWYMDIQGKVYLAPPGSITDTPVFSNGTIIGQPCWGISGECFGSPEEVLSYTFSISKAQYPKAAYGVPQLVANSPTQWTATYNYSIPEIYLNNMSGTKIITSRIANIACSQGTGYPGTGTGCVSAGLSSSPYAGAPVIGYPLQTSYDALPQAAKSAPMTAELVAEMANRLYRDASAQPGFQGIPFSELNPTVATDVAPYKSAHPEVWPTTSGINQPVPTTSSPSTDPIVWPDPVPPSATGPTTSTIKTTGSFTDAAGNKTTTESSSVIDWGQFTPPDIDTPSTESILDPLFSMWPSWQNFAFPQHQSTCPTPSFQLPAGVMGGMNIHFVELCSWVEMVRPAMQAAFAVAWAILIAFIVMGA